MPRAAADGPSGSPRVTPRRRRLEAGKCGDAAAGRWSAGNAGCPERLGRTAAAGRHGVWFTAFAALHAGLRSPVARGLRFPARARRAAVRCDIATGRGRPTGVVRLAERLDDTVGLSAFRSKYADVVVCSGCVSGSGDLPPGAEAVGHHLSVLARGQQVSAWPEVRGYRAEHGEEPLRVGV